MVTCLDDASWSPANLECAGMSAAVTLSDIRKKSADVAIDGLKMIQKVIEICHSYLNVTICSKLGDLLR